MTVDKNKYILSINGMSKSFGRNKVLKHISLNVKPGTIMGLMGENGAGKSTLMKMLCGIRYALLPQRMTESISFIQASTYSGTCIPKTLSSLAPMTGQSASA